MKYNKIRKMDISNGPGVRVSIFMQGCTFNCKNCFNPETHDFNGGKEFTDETINRVLELCEKDYIVGLSLLGGEPLHPKNIEGSTKLAKAFKEKFPEKNIWVWSGFLFDQHLKDKEILNYIDVLVDGQYNDELRDPRLKWCGSSNQRVIDVKKSLNKKEIVLFEIRGVKMKIRGFEIAKGYEECNINLPKRATKNSAAYDIEAAEEIVLPPFQKGMKPSLIKTGLKAYMQSDEVLMIVPRSSGPKKQGVLFPHSMGVIDSDYYENETNDGHIFVQCINIKDEEVVIKKGEKVAQAYFQKFLTIDNDDAEGVRTGGFGSTDNK